RGVGGPIRECGLTLWAWTGGPTRPHVPHRAAFLPVSDRPVRRGQDVAAATLVPVTEADARVDHTIRPCRRNIVRRCGRYIAPAHRHCFPGFPPARPHDDL